MSVLRTKSVDALLAHTADGDARPDRLRRRLGAMDLMGFGMLADLVSIGTLFAFLIVSIAVPVLRRTRSDLKRPFRVPLSPVVPILPALACLYLMGNLSIETWLRFVIWLAIGMVVYLGYGRRHARVAVEEPYADETVRATPEVEVAPGGMTT